LKKKLDEFMEGNLIETREPTEDEARTFLENLSENYDVIIFDTAPAFNAYTTSAIYTSSVYPVILPGINELLGLNATINFTQGLGKDISGIILIRKEKTALSDQIQEQLQEEYKDYLLKNK